MNKISFKGVVKLIIAIIILVCVYFILDTFFGKNNLEQQKNAFLKNYSVNEYTPIYISDEKMSQIYLTDYIGILYNNPEEAYNLLDKEYKEKNFNTYEKFKSYISVLDLSSNVKDYLKSHSKDYIIFKVHDTNDNLIIFKTKGVMQYSVYFDEAKEN